MANKKYNEFPTGTYDPYKIFLQADDTTSELEQIYLPQSPQILPYPQPPMAADAALNLDGNNFIVTSDGEYASTGLSMSPSNTESDLTIYLPSALRGVFQLVKDSFGWLISAKNGDNGFISMRSAELQIGISDASVLGIRFRSDSIQFNAGNYFTFTEFLEYTDNAAAITAGLPVGTLYRTGDIVKQVHS